MKKIFPIVFLSIFLFQFSNCKPEGKGTFVLTLKSDLTITASEEQKIIEIVKQRLERLEIDADDIQVTPTKGQFEVKISGMSNYPADMKESIRTAITKEGTLQLWETYTMEEVGYCFTNSLEAIDSVNAMRRFSSLVAINPAITDGMQGFKLCELGSSKISDTAKVNLMMDTILSKGFFPSNFEYRWSMPHLIDNKMACSLLLLKSSGNSHARMENPQMDKVELVKGVNGTQEIQCHLTGFDATAWQRMTRENIDRSIAIVVDNMVYSWPRVMQEIPGGVFVIMGVYQPDEDKQLDANEQLKALLETPTFPVPLMIAEETFIP
jgi:SecD/SecF fusion protein